MLPFWIHALGKGYSRKDYEIEKIKYYHTGMSRDILILRATYPRDTYERDIGTLEITKKYSSDYSDSEYEYKKADIKRKYGRITENEFKIAELKYFLSKEMISEYDYESQIADLTLSGKDKETKINEINYQYGLISEYDFEINKINITYPSKNNKMYKTAILDIDRKYNKISEYEYELQMNDLIYDKDTKDWYMKKNDIELKFGKITEHKHEKTKLTINGEPYFSVVSEKYDDGKIEFELDWNDIFIKKLKEEGMVGYTDQQMVDLYFKEICKQIAEEEEIFEHKEDGFGPSISRYETDDGIFYS